LSNDFSSLLNSILLPSTSVATDLESSSKQFLVEYFDILQVFWWALAVIDQLPISWLSTGQWKLRHFSHSLTTELRKNSFIVIAY
jgi:hypothetical protein